MIWEPICMARVDLYVVWIAYHVNRVQKNDGEEETDDAHEPSKGRHLFHIWEMQGDERDDGKWRHAEGL